MNGINLQLFESLLRSVILMSDLKPKSKNALCARRGALTEGWAFTGTESALPARLMDSLDTTTLSIEGNNVVEQ
jgi:hypothetical protein